MNSTQVFKVIIAGRPNVGKSSLFNRLIQKTQRKHTKDTGVYQLSSSTGKSIVEDYEGVTRDIIEAELSLDGNKIILFDSPGQMMEGAEIHSVMDANAKKAYDKADLILLVCDGSAPPTGGDQTLAKQIRLIAGKSKDCYLIVNKMDAKSADLSGFYAFGYPLLSVSAMRDMGINELLTIITARARENLEAQQALSSHESTDHLQEDDVDKNYTGDTKDTTGATTREHEAEALMERDSLVILGSPNAGKSTLTNWLLKEEKQLVHHLPGSTRDSVRHKFKLGGKTWFLVDTAGIRRRSKVSGSLEEKSVQAAIKAMSYAKIVFYLVDGEIGLRHHDLRLLEMLSKKGRGLIIGINKADLLSKDEKKEISRTLEWQLGFMENVPVSFISAKTGRGVSTMLKSVKMVYRSMMAEYTNSMLNRHLHQFIVQHPPPLDQGRRSSLRYVTQIATSPPHIVIHGKRCDHLPASYKKYLVNQFTSCMKLTGTPLRLSFRQDPNPYQPK